MTRYVKDTLNELMENVDFKAEWDALEPEFQIIRAMIDARNEKAVFELELPPMLEQISFDAEGRLYMIFESPAAAYRLWPARQVDRVVVLGVGTAENLLNITG